MGRRRRRVRTGGIRLRPRYARDLHTPDGLLDLFLQDIRYEYVDPEIFVFIERRDFKTNHRYTEKQYHRYSNVKVSGEVLELLKERKNTIRNILGAYEVINVTTMRDPRYDWRSNRVWAMERRWAYFHKDFIENTFVLDKHFGYRLSLDFPEGIGDLGKANKTTSISRDLKEKLFELKKKHKYETLNHLIYMILIRGERDFEGFLGKLRAYIERELRRFHRMGSVGKKKYFTLNAKHFLEQWHKKGYLDNPPSFFI